MSTHKHVDILCLALCLVILVLVSGLLLWKEPQARSDWGEGAEPDYASGLLDPSTVHTIDLTMEDWSGFLESCEDEKYVLCSAVIDGETVQDIGIRAKGNTSLSSVKAYGNDRYSFKLEFDHYQEGGNYQGLDKLSLNNIIQDNTYLKDYLTYRMMDAFGVDAPLCSYVYLTVNGEDWGLYLAVEAVEESFLERNYGGGPGELYKPDATDMGGGKGAGGDFDMPEGFSGQGDQEAPEGMEPPENAAPSGTEPPENFDPTFDPTNGERPEGEKPMEGGGFALGADDVKLRYTEDAFESYANIFDNAKTEITDADKARLIASLKTLNEGTDIESVVDVDEVIRYFVVHNFVCNFDSYTGSMVHNYYLYEEDGVLSMIPWDYNLAFGGFQSMEDATALVNYPIDEPVSGGSVEDRPMLAWIFASAAYTEQYHEAFSAFLAQFFTSGWLEEEIDRVSEMIAPYVEKDPTKFCTYAEFQTGVETLRAFCLLRAQSIQGQLDGTIPADSQGQKEESAALVDASSLTISDMGSMGNMGPGGGGPDRGEPPEGAAAQRPERPSGEMPTERPADN